MSAAAVCANSADAGLGVVATLNELIRLRAQALPERWQRTAAGSTAPGSHFSYSKSRGMEFVEVRPYQSGDDVRMLDWRQTARRGRPYTKLFQEEHERPVQLLVDLGASMRFGSRVAFKSVLAARAAALLAWRAVAAGDRVGAMVCNGSDMRAIRPQGRHSGVLSVLGCIAAQSAAYAAHACVLAMPLHMLARTVRPGSQVVVLSDFSTLDAEAEHQILALASASELTLVHIYDGLEAQAPPPGCYRITDGKQSLTLDLRSAAARSAYAADFVARGLALAQLARRSGAALLALATHMAPESVLASGWKHAPGARQPTVRFLP